MGLEKVKYKGFIFPIVIGLIIWFTAPIRPAGVSVVAWHMLALFIATIVGCITQPISIAGVTLIGFTLMIFTGLVPMKPALAAFSNSAAWLIAMAFLISRGFIKTGLGRRIALNFIKWFGKRSLGLGYAVAGVDLVTSVATPSNTARAGGIVYPIVASLADTFDSQPDNGESARKIGSYLVFTEFHINLITSAMFMTAMAPNLVVVALAKQLGVHITWFGWFAAGVLPGVICLLLVPFLIYKIFPPKVKETPNAKEWAQDKLAEMGPMKTSEKIMGIVFILTLVLWMISSFIGVEAYAVGFLAIVLLLVTGVLSVKDLLNETGAWNVLIWLSILVFMAAQLTKMGFIPWMVKAFGGMLHGINWIVVLAALMLFYFYSHYLFASATAHSTAMYGALLGVALAAHVPTMLAAMMLAFITALMSSTTHYANGPASILATSGYVKQSTWWKLNVVMGIVYLLIFGLVGPLWMKLIGMW